MSGHPRVFSLQGGTFDCDWTNGWSYLNQNRKHQSNNLPAGWYTSCPMLSIHGSILYPPSRIALKVALRQGRVCKYMYLYIYVYILYIYIDLLVRNVLRLGSFPAPKTCSTAFTSSFKAADICRTSCYILPALLSHKNKLQCTVSISLLCSDFFRTNKHPSRNDSTTYASLDNSNLLPKPMNQTWWRSEQHAAATSWLRIWNSKDTWSRNLFCILFPLLVHPCSLIWKPNIMRCQRIFPSSSKA